MLLQISPAEYHAFKGRLDEMHQQRGRVFRDRLDWNVNVVDGREYDEYDALNPTYLLYIGHDGALRGSVRMLPTTGQYMLKDTFPQLLGDNEAPQNTVMWESSRFCVETEGDPKTQNNLSAGCIQLFEGLIEFGLSKGLTSIVTVTDVLIERIIRRVGWSVTRIGEVKSIGTSKAVALDLSVDLQSLQNIRNYSGLYEPVLWTLPTGPQTAPQLQTLGEAQNIYSSLTYLRQRAEEIGLPEIATHISSVQGTVTNAMMSQANG